jgi:hypothetical protein
MNLKAGCVTCCFLCYEIKLLFIMELVTLVLFQGSRLGFVFVLLQFNAAKRSLRIDQHRLAPSWEYKQVS